MKKLMIGTLALFTMGFSASAQTAAKATVAKTVSLQKVATTAATAKTAPAKTVTMQKSTTTKPLTVATTKPAVAAVSAKSNGTADLHKANKAVVKTSPAGPAKKDGTPDKRYKANKNS